MSHFAYHDPLPPALAESLEACVLSAERCAAAADGQPPRPEAADAARDAAALARCAAFLVVRGSPFAEEATRMAISAISNCRRACELHTEDPFSQCAEACARCEAHYREILYIQCDRLSRA